MSASVNIESNLARLSLGVQMYVRASKKGVDFAVSKHSAELGRNLAKTSKGLMPAKGAITKERLEALKSGEGLRIRKTTINWLAEKYNPTTSLALRATLINVRSGKKQKGKKVVAMATRVLDPDSGKLVNFQALAVKRELAVRESGRGFLSHSERLGLGRADLNATRRIEKSISRYGPRLGEFGFSTSATGATAMFKWGGFSELSNEAVKAMGRAKGQAAINDAIVATVDNLIPFLDRKLGADAVKVLLK